MNHRDLIQSQHTVKLRQHTLVVIHQIVSGIVHMAGIETYPQSVFSIHFIINHPQFFKSSANLTALARHSFQRNPDIAVIRIKHQIQSLCDLLHSLFHTGT